MKDLHRMKEALIGQIQAQMGHLEQVNTKELGEAIDMVKDLSEAIYYCTITEAMEEKKEKEVYYYPIETEKPQTNRMYYGKKDGWGEGYQYPMDIDMWKDEKDGRSPHKRRMYMEGKENHHDKASQMQNLEQYMKELSSDVVEMIQGSSPEEKQLLKSKLTTLISKIDHA